MFRNKNLSSKCATVLSKTNTIPPCLCLSSVVQCRLFSFNQSSPMCPWLLSQPAVQSPRFIQTAKARNKSDFDWRCTWNSSAFTVVFLLFDSRACQNQGLVCWVSASENCAGGTPLNTVKFPTKDCPDHPSYKLSFNYYFLFFIHGHGLWRWSKALEFWKPILTPWRSSKNVKN